MRLHDVRSGRFRLTAGYAALALGAGACGIIDPGRPCTLMACSDGVIVQLPSMPTIPFRVEVVVGGAPGNQPVYTYDCPDVTRCTQNIFFPGLIAGSASVTVRTAAGARTTQVPELTYVTTRPNGPDCPPECRQATVTAALPA